MPFGAEKPEWLGYPLVKQFEDIAARFDRMYERDRQPDRHTHGHRIRAKTALDMLASRGNHWIFSLR